MGERRVELDGEGGEEVATEILSLGWQTKEKENQPRAQDSPKGRYRKIPPFGEGGKVRSERKGGELVVVGRKGEVEEIEARLC